MGVRVECCTTQEVFALGHLMWLTFSKEEFKTPNMFLGKVRHFFFLPTASVFVTKLTTASDRRGQAW